MLRLGSEGALFDFSRFLSLPLTLSCSRLNGTLDHVTGRAIRIEYD